MPNTFSWGGSDQSEPMVIIHRRRTDGRDASFAFESSAWSFWDTCIRRLAIGHAGLVPESLEHGDEIYQGEKAYEFVLEVVCGLHSPVKGETEVQGQFRAYVDKLGAGPLKVILQKVYADAKVVRDAHLRGLGSQSYGSFARRKMRECTAIDIVGSGHLAREILPWLLKAQKPVRLHVREPGRVADLAQRYPQLTLHNLRDPLSMLGGLIVAAPMKSEELRRWAGDVLHDAELILDFRAESVRDSLTVDGPLAVRAPYTSLEAIFAEIEVTKERVQKQVDHALSHIRDLVYASQNSRAQK